jgi:hypothetical protein
MSNVCLVIQLTGSLLFSDRLPRKFGLVALADISAQDVAITVAGNGGSLILGTASLDQADRSGGARKPCGRSCPGAA